MKRIGRNNKSIIFIFIFIVYQLFSNSLKAQTCSSADCSNILTFIVDLSSKPDSLWVSPDTYRSGSCCGSKKSDNCIRFIITTHPQTTQLSFQLLTPPIPPGQTYQLNCGPLVSVGTPLCLSGTGPHCVVYCKGGVDLSKYGLLVSKGVIASPNLSVTSSCNKDMSISGGNDASIVWRSITDAAGNPANGVYNSFLSCTSVCAATTFTAPAFGAALYPSVGYVDFEVSKTIPATACAPGYTFKDTIRMNVIQKTVVTISPPTQSICFENTTTTITANPSFGTPPYTYLWSNGATTQSIAVPAGDYTVQVSDVNTNATCLPATSASIKVAKNTGPNTANVGGNTTICTGGTVALNGSITSYDALGNPVVSTTSGGVWSGGTGTYNPNASTPNAIYTPSAAERSAGTVALTLTTTNNGGCPAGSGVKTITIDPIPTVYAGANQSVCKNNPVATLLGTSSNTTSVLWTSPTGGTFSAASSLNTTYTPSAADLSNGSVILTLRGNAAVCSSVTSTMTITYTASPTANAGPASVNFCSNNPQIQLAGSVTLATGGIWSNGSGTFNPSNTDLNAIYYPSPAEVSAGVIALFLTTTGHGNCNLAKDTILLFSVPIVTVSAGPNANVCRNNPTVSLSGSTTGAIASVSWSSPTSGAAGFTSGNTLNTSYTLNAADLTNGSVALTLTANPLEVTCSPVTATVIITVIAPPTVNAGADQTNLCFNPGTAVLNGFSSTGSGTWTGGAGTFTPDATTANATYNSTVGERGTGVTLTYTTTNHNVLCIPESDNVTISFGPQITVDAGPPVSVCSNNAVATLSGSSPVTGSGQWSGGTGVFTPNANTLNAIYTPSAAEIAAATPITLTLASAGSSCSAVTDNTQVLFTPIPTITISGGTVCADNPAATITTALTIASGVTWSGGAGTFSPNNTSTNFTYTPTLSEIGAGSVVLTATSTGNSNCNPVTNNVTVTIAPIPVVDAGPDQVLCGSTASVSLNGIVTGATGGQWTSSGTGTFSNASSVVTTYTPSAADKTSGLVTLTLTSTGHGLCNAVNNSMNLTFTIVPTVNAGPNQIVCTNDFPVQLNGTGSPATWVGGVGTFTPGRTAMNATYTPDATEVSAGTVTLTLTTNPSGACPQVSSTVTISISQPPIASPGAPFTVCGDVTTINLSGTVNTPIATGGVWTTTGTGTIANPSSLTTTYAPSATDKSNGSVTFTLTTTGSTNCSPTSADLVVTISPVVTVFAGPDRTLCNVVPSVALPLAGAVITGATNGTWSIVSGGTGSLTNPTSALSVTYTPNVADVTVIFRLTTTNNPVGCAPLSDEVEYTFTAIPTVNAGPPQTVCADVTLVNLAGSVGGSATTARWSTNGSGTFSPNNTTLNAQYIPALNETGNFNFVLTSDINGPCTVASSTMVLTVTPRPTANAGSSQIVCANNPAVTVTGTVTQATGGTWTTAGDGIFSGVSGNGLTATYTPGSNDISNGSVALTLTTTGMGTCNAVSDMMLITITPAPVPNAGPDRSVCANNPAVNLIGAVTVTSAGTWSTLGSGTFSSVSVDGLTATYTPSAGDISAGSVTLRLTSANNGLCTPVAEDMLLTITAAPTVNVGPDHVICADSFYLKLNVAHTVSIAGIWSSSSGGSFFATPVIDTAMYVPTAADRAAGVVILTYTTTSQGSCNPVSDNLMLTITPAPTVNAGPDQIICSTTPSITISASKTVSSGIRWTSSGSGTFGSTTSLSTTYSPSAIDILAGSVILTSTTTGSGTCRNVNDQITLTITPQPTVNVGPDITVCADLISSGFLLTPTLNNVFNTVWSTTGSGIFSINNTTNNATYIPSAADTTAGSVTITNVASGFTPCGTSSDSKLITFRKVPRVNAGVDQLVCNGSNINLSGSVANASGGTWTSSGTGSFSPDANTLSAIYTPSPTDTTSGNITLTLTSTGMGTCAPVSDNLLINFQKRPLVNAGTDQTVCLDEDTIKLVGFTTNAPGGNWSGTGNGTYIPDNLMPIADYLVTNADRAKGQLVFTLTTINTAPCAAVSDNVTITFRPLPVVNIGPDLTVCAGTPTINLGVTLTNATGGTWSTTGNGTFDNASSTNPVYTFGGSDNSGLVLTYTATTGIGLCSPVSASLTVNFVATLVSDAGPPTRTVCTTDLPVTLSGSGAVGTWTTSGDGTFSNANQLTSIYTPGITDLSNTSVILTLTPVGMCPGTPDNITLNFIPGPTINAGPSRDICTDVTTITMNGSSSDPAAAWTSSGSGGFNNNSITAIYTLTSSDISSGSLVITYRIPSNGVCNAIQDTMTVTIRPIPGVSAGPDKTRCANLLTSITMNGSHTVASGVQWTKLTNPGMGTLTNGTSDVATYTPDVTDVAFGTILFELQIPPVSKGFCTATYSDTMALIITPAPILTIGPDSTVCADRQIPLGAAFSVATGGIWTTTNGSGTFSPSSTLPGATYIPSAADTAAHTVTLVFTTTGNGICIAASEDRVITMVPKPSVSAGADFAICSGNTNTNLSGSFNNAGGIRWQTTGTGNFTPDEFTLGAVYTPSQQDKDNGGVTLSLKTTGITECDTVADYVVLQIVPSPVATVFAGANQIICRDESHAQLNGVIQIATAARWDCQGAPCSGVFLPSDSDLEARYVPSAADTASGTIFIRLTTTDGNGICAPNYDEMELTILDVPKVNAGMPQTVCADTAGITLNGSVFHSFFVPPGYSWSSSGDGIFAPNAFVSNPTYIPSSDDIANGSVGFTLTSTNNGTCQAYNDVVTSTITPKPAVNAGPDQITCANVTGINLVGTHTVATTSVWTSSTGGTFSGVSANGLDAVYNLSALDTTVGVVTLRLTTTAGLGSCKAASDEITFTINHAPIANVGPDKTICADANINLSATVKNATGGIWSTLGTGTFSSSTNQLNNIYIPSVGDTLAGTVDLVLTTTGNGVLCLPEDDTITVTIDPRPFLVPGSVSICRIVNGATLNGTVFNATGGKWSTSGTGVFAPHIFDLNAMYYPSLADYNAGQVTLTLTSEGNGLCNPVSATTNLSISPTPIADAGVDQFVCSGTTVTLSAAVDPINSVYEWKDISNAILAANATSIDVPITANTFIVLTVYDHKNCPSDNDTVLVRSYNMPSSINLTGTNCFTDSNSIVASIVEGVPTPPLPFYQWFKDGVIMSGENNLQIHPTSMGSYRFVYSFGDCQSPSAPFTINPSPSLAGIDKTNCVNNTTVLATSNVTGGSSFTYNWDADPTIIGPVNTSQITVQSNLTFDTIPYRVTVTNEFTCSTSDSVYLISVAKPLLTLDNDTLCQNQVTTLTAIPTNFGVGSIPPIEDFFPTYTWTRDGVNLNNNSNSQVVTVPGKYIVEITIGDCNNNKDSSQILYNNFAITTLPEETKFCSETDSVVVLDPQITVPTGYTYTYLWTPSNDTTAVISANQEAMYYLTVTSIIGSNSCPVKDSVNVRNLCPPRLFVPNAFTPDKDGNSTFKIFGDHFKDFSIVIFNRWGEIIFTNDNLEYMRTIGWDGKYKEEPMPLGVYPYVIYYDGEEKEFAGPYKKEGDVLILR